MSEEKKVDRIDDERQNIYEKYEMKDAPPKVEEVEEKQEIIEEVKEEVITEATEEKEPVKEEPETVTVKIYGEERSVPKTEVDEAGGVNLYQIKIASEEKMGQIKEEKENLKQEREKVEKLRAELEAFQKQKTTETETDSKRVALAELNKRYREALDEDKFTDAADIQIQIDELLHGKEKPVEDVDAVVSNRISQYDREVEFRQANEWYIEKYPDLAGDDMLNGMVASQYTALKTQNPDASERKLVEASVEAVNEWYVQKTSATANDRTERKRELKQQPKAAAVKQAPPEEPVPLSPSEIVAEIRKSRGQHV